MTPWTPLYNPQGSPSKCHLNEEEIALKDHFKIPFRDLAVKFYVVLLLKLFKVNITYLVTYNSENFWEIFTFFESSENTRKVK